RPGLPARASRRLAAALLRPADARRGGERRRPARARALGVRRGAAHAALPARDHDGMSANALDDLPGMGPRSRRNAVLVLAIWSVFAVVPMVNFFGEHRAAWRIVVVVAAYVPFIVVYQNAMIRLRRRAPEPADRPFIAALVALSAVLIAAGGEPFVAMLVFTSVAARRRLQPHEARRVVFALGAGAAVTTCTRRARRSRGSPLPTSACGSRATCTTCSATRCR